MDAPQQQQPLTPLDVQTLVVRALEALKDLPSEQQQAVLEAAASTARAASELRQRLYLTGTMVANMNRR